MESLVTNIVALTILVFAFAVMVCWDLQKFQQCNFSPKKFYQWITDNDEQITLKRASVIVAFMGVLAFGQSWMVIALLSFFVLGSTVNFVIIQKNSLFSFSDSISRRFILEFLMMLVIVACAAFWGDDLETKLQYALFALLLLTIFSYAFTIATNWVMKPMFDKK